MCGARPAGSITLYILQLVTSGDSRANVGLHPKDLASPLAGDHFVIEHVK